MVFILLGMLVLCNVTYPGKVYLLVTRLHKRIHVYIYIYIVWDLSFTYSITYMLIQTKTKTAMYTPHVTYVC